MTMLLLSEAMRHAHAAALYTIARQHAVELQLVSLDEAEQRGTALQRVELAWYSLDMLAGGAPTGCDTQRLFALLQRAPALRWLHLMSAGTDLPLYDAIKQRELVAMSCGSGIAAVPVAHSAVAALMALARGFEHWLQARQRRSWSRLPAPPRDLPGQRVVVVGMGPIGQEIARLLVALGMYVMGVRRQALPLAGVECVISYADLPAAATQADWLVLCCPLTRETQGLVNASLLAQLPRGAGLINVGRGEVVDEAALVAALQSGQLGAAYLDVFAQEPLPADSPLWSLPKVWLSPHNAAASQGNPGREAELFLRNLDHFLAQRPLENLR